MSIYPVSTVNEKSGTVVRKYFRNKTQIAKVVEYGEKSKMRNYGIFRMDVLNGREGKYFNYYNEKNNMLLSMSKTPDSSIGRVAVCPQGFQQFINKISFPNTLKNFIRFLEWSKHLAK